MTTTAAELRDRPQGAAWTQTDTSTVTAGSGLLSNLVGGMVPPKQGVQMRSDTQSVTIAAAPGQVLAFVADGANLPRWAIGFARSLRPGPSGWILGTAQGEA